MATWRPKRTRSQQAKRSGSQITWMALRRACARRDGYKCHYCQVPTAATIEHIDPRKARDGSADGTNALTNLVLACPRCNSTRGNMPYEKWVASKGWVLPWPKDLEGDIAQMVAKHFKTQQRGRYIWTASTNSRVRLPAADSEPVVLEVRAGSDWKWHEFHLGDAGTRTTLYGVYEFMRRHVTSEKC